MILLLDFSYITQVCYIYIYHSLTLTQGIILYITHWYCAYHSGIIIYITHLYCIFRDILHISRSEVLNHGACGYIIYLRYLTQGYSLTRAGKQCTYHSWSFHTTQGDFHSLMCLTQRYGQRNQCNCTHTGHVVHTHRQVTGVSLI